MSNQVFQNFLQNLERDGFSVEQLAAISAYETRASSAGLYQIICSVLTEEDLQDIESIQDDDQAMKRIEQLFEQRAGVSVEVAMQQIQEVLRKTQSYTKK